MMSIIANAAAWALIGFTLVSSVVFGWLEDVSTDIRAALEGFWHSPDIHKVASDPCCDFWECEHG